MTTIRKIVTSQVDGNSANANDIDEIRPFGETSFYIDTSGPDDKLVLSMFDGQRTHLKSKVVGPGVLYGSNADSGDGLGLDTIKLIPDASLHYNDGNYSNDQYLVVDPTAPNHIHIRAGGTIDNSSADLFLGGELTNVRVSDGYENVTIRTSNDSGGSVIPKEWIFDNTGKLSFPMGGAIEPVGMGWVGLTNGETGSPISVIQQSINVSYTGQPLSDITLSNDNDWTTGNVWIGTSNLVAGTSYQWTFGPDGTLTLPSTATIVDTAVVEAAGTKITVPLNAAGDTVDYVGGASVIEIPKNADTNQVQAGWIITFPDSTERTVTGVLDGVLYWSVQYAEANPGLGAGTYPLTIESPDYTVASAGAITLAKSGHSWSFDSDGKITMGAGVTIDTEGALSQGDFNLTLPGITGTPQLFRFTDEGGVGEIVFPIGTRTDGVLTVTPADEDVVLQTNYRTTIPATATFGSTTDTLVVDIFENDDVSAAVVGWEIDIGTGEESNWVPIASTVLDPGNTFTITIASGFEFIQGTTYIVRKIEANEKIWRFRATGPMVAPGGAILSSETAEIENTFITYNNTSTERPVSVYWESNIDQPDLRYLHLGVTSDTAMPLYAAALEITGQIEPYGMIGGRIIRFTDTSGKIYSLTIPAYSNISAQMSIAALGGDGGISWLIQEGSWGVTGAPTDDTVINIVSLSYSDLATTYRDFAIELPSQDGENEYRWEFDNSGDMIAPGAITIAGTLNTPLGSIVGVGTDQNYVGIQAVADAGVIIRATDDENNFIDWTFGTDGGLTTPYGLQISDQYIQHPATGNFISLNNDTGVDVMSNGVLQLVSNFGAADAGDRRYWQLNTNGSITFPDDTVQTTAWAGGRVVSVPGSSAGASGDKAGDIAFDGTYMYYCAYDYGSAPSETFTVVNVGEFTNSITVNMSANPNYTVPQAGWTTTVGTLMTLTAFSGVSGSNYNFLFDVSSTDPLPSTVTLTSPTPYTNIWKRIAWSGDTW